MGEVGEVGEVGFDGRAENWEIRQVEAEKTEYEKLKEMLNIKVGLRVFYFFLCYAKQIKQTGEEVEDDAVLCVCVCVGRGTEEEREV